MTHIMRGAGLVVLALGLCLLAAPSSSTAAGDADGVKLTEAQFKALVEKAIADVDQGMKDWKDTKIKEKERKEHYRKARGAAVMIAAYAQAAEGNAMERATLRDTALKMAALIEKDNTKDARKILDEIKGGVKANPKADIKPVQFMPKHVKIEEVMKQFSSKPGGSMLEAKLLQNYLANKKVEKAKELPAKVLNEEYALMALQTAIISEIVGNHKPQKKEGKTEKDWKEYNTDMHKETLELMKLALADKKDGKAAFKTLTKLDSSCYRCHKIWRDSD
jgi:hypothetical protein